MAFLAKKMAENLAVLYYTSWWDFGGIEFEIGGIDPNCHHPKPRPTTPRDFFDFIYFQYQKENLGSDHFKTHPNIMRSKRDPNLL